MTTATVKVKTEERLDVGNLHPVLSSRLQIEQAGKELTRLEEQERTLSAERIELIRATESPRTQSRLEEIESEINRLQTRQRREQDKISALKAELPELRKEAEEQLDQLMALESRGEKLGAEIKTLNNDIWKICDSELVHRLRGLAEKREGVVADLRKLPHLIRGVKSFFHMAPEVTEVDIPALDQKVLNVGKALSK